MVEIGNDTRPGGTGCQKIERETLPLLVQAMDFGMLLHLDTSLGRWHFLFFQACTSIPSGCLDLPVLSFLFCFFFFPRGHVRKFPRLGVKSGATAAGLCHSHSNTRSKPVCNLYHSSGQHRIPDILSAARDRTRILMVTGRI